MLLIYLIKYYINLKKMMRGAANVYNLPEQCFSRTMCSVTADTLSHKFLIATNTIKK